MLVARSGQQCSQGNAGPSTSAGGMDDRSQYAKAEVNNIAMHPNSRQARPLMMHKSVSTPVLKSLAVGASAEHGLEVYVVLRNFQEFGGGVFHKLPGPLRDGLRDSGVCHYMTVFKQSDGSMVQFDFGPVAGGDIHVPAPGPLGRVFNKSSAKKTKVLGQVRERYLSAMPDCHMYMGTTNLSLSDIRAWNRIHASSVYELHHSDCRHYVNALVRYTTGVERAATSALRHQWARHHKRRGIASQLIRLGQYFTDAANWQQVRALGNATSAALMTLAGHQTLARLGAAPILKSVQARILPGARGSLAPVQRALIQRPVYAVSTAAVASTVVSSGESLPLGAAGIRRNVVTTMQNAVRAAAHFADNIGRSAVVASQRTASSAASLATGLVQVAARQPNDASTSSHARARITKPSKVNFPWSNSPDSMQRQQPGRRVGAAVQQLAIIATRR